MSELYIHSGSSAHSPGTLQKILTRLRDSFPEVTTIESRFVHIVWTNRPLTEEELDIIHSLLRYGSTVTSQPTTERRCTVVPRVGTLSPWSSKATDIFGLCNLESVVRVERGMRWHLNSWHSDMSQILHDRMTETVMFEEDFAPLFEALAPKPLQSIALNDNPIEVLTKHSTEHSLALSVDEIEYLADVFSTLKRDPTDVELMMFAQANSEHCRHKIFNAKWIVDGEEEPASLFDMIRQTTESINHQGIRSAYRDNAAVMEGNYSKRFHPFPHNQTYGYRTTPMDVVLKVETHNHPTAISPYAGAATGSGGEIRDEGAVGRGSKPVAGVVGYTTSHLRIPEDPQPWESDLGKPSRIASALEIMIDGPLGSAAYNNEYGRPALCGYFRTFEHQVSSTKYWGYHKPIMIAGGIGSIERNNISIGKRPNETEFHIVVLGGPSFLIGLGGGSSSSVSSGQSSEDLDFASVQRDNAELERRCQEVIDYCTSLDEENPLVRIHDVGAGGLSNAIPELMNDLGLGGNIRLREVPSADKSMSPLEIWCNESQERYVLAVRLQSLDVLQWVCSRERCPYAIIGETRTDGKLVVEDSNLDSCPIDLDLDVVLGKPPKMVRSFERQYPPVSNIHLSEINLQDALTRVLRFPVVGSKKFLITIGDRSITGLIARDQMVGPYQVPVADAAITIAGYDTYRGEAVSMGERSPVGITDAAASVRLAIAEALTNLASVSMESLDRIVLSANWMAAPNSPNQDQALFDAVAASSDLCQLLGIAIPVGKDSLSMCTKWQSAGNDFEVTSPVSLNVTAAVPVTDVRSALTPQLTGTDSQLVLVSLSKHNRLGGSVLSQVYSQLGDPSPDVESAELLRKLMEFSQWMLTHKYTHSVHDRSDGGLIITLLEMAFAGRMGIEVRVNHAPLEELFSEEIGLVFEVSEDNIREVMYQARTMSLTASIVGKVTSRNEVCITHNGEVLFRESLVELERTWSKTSYLIQRMRDEPHCADSEFELIGKDPGLCEQLTFKVDQRSYYAPPSMVRPKVAILRDQGVNGQIEMAAAFVCAGFNCVDVHMSDLFSQSVTLADFDVLALCGGFSYGDVLGGGGGWAKSILFNEHVREEFQTFFERPNGLTLGVCNGFQMLVQLNSLIPGTNHWPSIETNISDRFEARTVQVKIEQSDSLWLVGMSGSQLIVPVAHGQGQVRCRNTTVSELAACGQVAFRYVDGHGVPTSTYPLNPNGSEDAIAGITSVDGRVLGLMPHPERVFRTIQLSWSGADEDREFSPWFQLFRNAHKAIVEQ